MNIEKIINDFAFYSGVSTTDVRFAIGDVGINEEGTKVWSVWLQTRDKRMGLSATGHSCEEAFKRLESLVELGKMYGEDLIREMAARNAESRKKGINKN